MDKEKTTYDHMVEACKTLTKFVDSSWNFKINIGKFVFDVNIQRCCENQIIPAKPQRIVKPRNFKIKRTQTTQDIVDYVFGNNFNKGE